MPMVRIGELEVSYEHAGEGPALVLLHGILGDSREWRPQLEGLSDRFSVIAWDAPGAGRSSDPPEDFSLADYADCLASLLDALELERAHVLGLSWGGVLAQEVYSRHPGRVTSLILADSYAGWKGSLPEEVVAERLEGAMRESELPPEEFVPGWLPGLVTESAPPELVDELTSIMSDFHPVGYRVMARTAAAAQQRDLLPRIQAPTLLIWGEADQRSPVSVAEELRDAIPGAELVLIPDAGHVSNIEQPDRFNSEVRRFCLSHSPED